jgi:hypothetical protein
LSHERFPCETLPIRLPVNPRVKTKSPRSPVLWQRGLRNF